MNLEAPNMGTPEEMVSQGTDPMAAPPASEMGGPLEPGMEQAALLPEQPEVDDFDKELLSTNLASKWKQEKIEELQEQVKSGFEEDLKSRYEWERCLDEWTKLAMQHRETKSYPWPKASNVKYPMLSTAAMQFAARAYPSLVPSNGKVVSADRKSVV